MPQDWKDILGEKFGVGLPLETEPEPLETGSETLRRQNLTVSIDRRRRAGKQVTLVSGFAGSDEALAELGKQLKARCGTGGTVKDRYILVQGDVRDKLVNILNEMGHRAKRGN